MTSNLKRVRAPLERFLKETSGLKAKRGPLLIQLPPSFAFERRRVKGFLDTLRSLYAGPLVCEARHETWFSAIASELLVSYRVARVATDPAILEIGKRPGAWAGIVYFRLHGSPRKYWSRYSEEYIDVLAQTLKEHSQSADTWCIFDNTASGAAIENALELRQRLTTSNREDMRREGKERGVHKTIRCERIETWDAAYKSRTAGLRRLSGIVKEPLCGKGTIESTSVSGVRNRIGWCSSI